MASITAPIFLKNTHTGVHIAAPLTHLSLDKMAAIS